MNKNGKINKSRNSKKSNLETPEGIKIRNLYTEKDLINLEHLHSFPGQEPFTRGPYETMYTEKPWTIRQYAGFSSAEKTNKFFINSLNSGQNALSVAFDLPTHRGYDSDNVLVKGEVGKAGVAIDSVEDMNILFKNIPLNKTSISMTMSGAVLPVLGSFIVAGEEQGHKLSDLSGTIQNDILKEFMVRNTYIYPPEPSMRIVGDIIFFLSKNIPNFNSISISGYHMQEAGANLVQELAYTLSNGLEYVKLATSRGMSIDDFAPRLSFFFCIGMNFFMEAAKLRAARYLWAYWIKKLFKPKNKKSLILKTHCQTSGASLTEQDPHNNIIRTTMEALSAILGGTQSLHTNSFDEAIGLPTDFSSKVALNTQLILQNETGITDTIDPLAGSYYVENLTGELISKSNIMIKDILNNGGMTKSIQEGVPKKEIEKMAISLQAQIDSGKKVIVGVNKYVSNRKSSVDALEIDDDQIRKIQTKRLKKLKLLRNNNKVNENLNSLKEAANSGNGNLLELTIQAIRSRATVGEISEAIGSKVGLYKSNVEIFNGVYKQAFKNKKELVKVSDQRLNFINQFGENLKIYLAKIGHDGHDRGAKVIASAFKDFDIEVEVGNLFQTPEEVANTAIELGSHVIGVSSLAAGHKTLLPKLINILKENEAEDIVVICGGIIPKRDHDYLLNSGVSAIFGPGEPITDIAMETFKVTSKHLKRMHNYRNARVKKE